MVLPDFDISRSPLISGLQGAQQGVENSVRNRYLGDLLRNQVLQGQLQNQKAQTEQPYWDQKAKAEALIQTITSENLDEDQKSQILRTQIENQRAQAELPFAGRQAEANVVGKEIQNRLSPLRALLDSQESQRKTSRFGKAYELSKMLSLMKDQGQQYIANNQEQYNSLVDEMANQLVSEKGSGEQAGNEGDMQDLITKSISDLIPGYQPPAKEQKNQERLKEDAKISKDIEQPVTESTQKFASSKEQSEDMALNTQYDLNKRAVTTNTRMKAEGAIALEDWLIENQAAHSEDINRYFDKFASLPKEIKRKIEAGEEMAGFSQKDYDLYKWAKNDFVTSIVNMIKKQEGLGATNEQREEMRNLLYAIEHADELSPETAKKLFNRSVKMLYQQGKAAQSAAEPKVQGVYERIQKKKHGDYPDYTKVDYLTPRDQGQKRVKVIGPNGKSGTISEANLREALEKGYEKV